MIEITLKTIDAKLSSIDSKVEDMDSKIESMDSKIENMDSKIESMDTKIDDLATATKQGFDDINNKFHHLESSFRSETQVTRARLNRVETHLGLV